MGRFKYVNLIGKPARPSTFEAIADTFVQSVFKAGQHCERIDDVFDRY